MLHPNFRLRFPGEIKNQIAASTWIKSVRCFSLSLIVPFSGSLVTFMEN